MQPERLVDRARQRGHEAVSLGGGKDLEEGALLADLAGKRLRDRGTIAVEVLGQQQLDLAVAFGQLVEALRQRAGRRIEVGAQEARDRRRGLARVRAQCVADSAQQTLALALNRLRVECPACVAQCNHPDAQGVLGEGIPLRPLVVLPELVDHFGVGDA